MYNKKHNSIFLILILVILSILIMGSKSTNNQTIYFNELNISNNLSIESLSSINITVDDSLSTANIVYNPRSNGTLDVNSNNGNTIVKEEAPRKFYIFYFEPDDYRPSISVYLPSSMINNLDIKTSSGEITFYNNIEAKSIKILSSSGDIDLLDIQASKVDLTTRSGEISTEDVNAMDSFIAKTSSGDISMKSLKAKNGTIRTSSGDIEISKANIADSLNARTSSGSIELELKNNQGFEIKTSSGTIEINDNKINSNSYGTGNEKFKFTTASGNIELNY